MGADGATHGGAFDITYMACLPNMVVMAPSNEAELIHMVATSAAIDDRPSCFRSALSLLLMQLARQAGSQSSSSVPGTNHIPIVFWYQASGITHAVSVTGTSHLVAFM